MVREKVSIIKWGFKADPDNFPHIDTVIAHFRWHKLCEQPNPTVIHVVREFYKNAYEHRGYQIIVKGKHVAFDKAIINQLYGLPNIDHDKYTYTIKDHDLDHVTVEFCVLNASWEVNNSGKQIKMSSESLYPDAHVWFHLLTRTLLSGSHITYITKEQIIILFSLLEYDFIDVVGLISSNIVRAAHYTHRSILLRPYH